MVWKSLFTPSSISMNEYLGCEILIYPLLWEMEMKMVDK